MRTVEFTIPYKITGKDSLNEIYAGKHWGGRSTYKEKMHIFLQSELRRQGIPKKLYRNQVKITFLWSGRLDLDNYGYLRKLIIDSLKGWILPDDNKKYVKKLCDEFSNNDVTTVIVEELSCQTK